MHTMIRYPYRVSVSITAERHMLDLSLRLKSRISRPMTDASFATTDDAFTWTTVTHGLWNYEADQYARLAKGPSPAMSNFWTNAATIGSVAATMLMNRPINTLHHIRIPALLLAVSHDTLCPTAGDKPAADIIPGATLVELPHTGHVDVCQGEVWNQVPECSG